MNVYEFNHHKGFKVLFESENFRVALHSYQSEINGVKSIGKWGIHHDSDETFLLLKGSAWLFEKNTAIGYKPLTPMEMVVIPKGREHAIVLAENCIVQIIENSDMSNSSQVDMTSEEISIITSMI